jgi:glucose/mannose-6-phosphate isomerase
MASMDLDDLGHYLANDPSHMAKRIAGLPEQCMKAWSEAKSFQLPNYSGIENVLFLGMGGSGVAGDMLVDVAALEATPPIIVCRDYRIPKFVGKDTLAIASSYSGDTDEVISSLDQAVRSGAKALVITGGGRLADMARELHLPVLIVDHQGEPRTALGYSFFTSLAFLDTLGLVSPKDSDVAEAVTVMKAVRAATLPETPESRNISKQIARECLGRMVTIYGEGVLKGVARRWKTQFNENAKNWAFLEFIPELNHNAVVGYQLPQHMEGRFFVILLSSSFKHPSTAVNYRVTEELLEKAGIGFRTVEALGQDPLGQMFGSILTGDFASYYLAILQGIDPSPVEVIKYFKGQVAKWRSSG